MKTDRFPFASKPAIFFSYLFGVKQATVLEKERKGDGRSLAVHAHMDESVVRLPFPISLLPSSLPAFLSSLMLRRLLIEKRSRVPDRHQKRVRGR